MTGYVIFGVALRVKPFVNMRERDATKLFGCILAPPFSVYGDVMGVHAWNISLKLSEKFFRPIAHRLIWPTFMPRFPQQISPHGLSDIRCRINFKNSV